MLSPMFVTKDPIVRPTRDLGGNNRRNSRSSVSRAGGGFAGLQQQQQQQQQQGQPPHLMQSQTRPHSDRIVLPQMASDVARSHISSPSTDTAPLSDASSFNSDPRSYNFQQNLDGPGETFTLAPTSPSKLESDTSERGSSEGNSHLAQLPVQQPDREDHVVSLGYGRQQPESKLQTIQNRRKSQEPKHNQKRQSLPGASATSSTQKSPRRSRPSATNGVATSLKVADATWTSRRLSHGNLTDLQHKYLRKSQQTQADDTPLDGQTFLRVRPSSHGQTSAVDQIDSPPLYREPRRSPDRVGTHVGRMASNRLPLRNPSSYRQPDLVYSDKPQNREPSPLRQEMRGVYLNLDPQTSSETDSVASSVPSTVWDELQVMKERIASIERAGGRDPAQLAGPVRPQTATNTTATTMSSSPHQVSGAPVGPPGTEKLHPLLHSAVLKARETTKPDITRSLDQCAMDALSLAAIIGTSGSASGAQSTVGSVSGSERQVRRKVESMCRSLTELAIALSDGSATHLIGHPSGEFMPPQYATQRLPSRDGAVSVLGLQRRGSSLEPDDIQSRASARFANPVPGRQLRQASLQPYAIHDRSSLGSVYTRSRIYQDEPMSSPIISTSRFPSGRTRSSTIALRRGQPTFDGANDSNEAEEDEPEQISGRAPSRARTEIGRSTSYQVASAREYRSIHALPIRQYSRNTVVETAPLPNATKAATFPLAQKEQPGQRGGEMSEEEKRAKMRQLAERTRGPDLSRAGGLKPSPRRRRQDVTSIDSTKTIGPDDVLGLKYAQRA